MTEFAIFHKKWAEIAFITSLLFCWPQYFEKPRWKSNLNLSKRVRKDRVFFGLAGLPLGISLGLCPWEMPWSSPASPREMPRSSLACPRKTPSFPPVLLRLIQSLQTGKNCCTADWGNERKICWMKQVTWCTYPEGWPAIHQRTASPYCLINCQTHLSNNKCCNICESCTLNLY